MFHFGEQFDFAMTILAGVSLTLTLAIFFLAVFTDRMIRKVRELPLPEASLKLPRVSLVAPARNEERNIERAVRTLLTLDYPDLQITLVNDRSTDQTGKILERLARENPRLNVVHLADLPSGWLGKNHAMQVGANRSDGEWLLFTDADVMFEPTTLKRTIRYALENQVDHLVGSPDTRMSSWLLKCFVVTFGLNFLIFVRAWAIRNPRSSAHVGIGAFNLVRGEVFRAIGGMQPIAMRPDDDIKLGKLIKLQGYRQDLVSGVGGMIVVEWYSSIHEMMLGLEKNMFAVLEYRLSAAVFVSVMMIVFNLWPFVAPLFTTGWARGLYLADVVCLLIMMLGVARGTGNPLSCALGYPLAMMLFLFIQWRAIFLTYWRGGIQWRDTRYSLVELRANRI